MLVEGYFDVVRLVLAGIETVVAPLGTVACMVVALQLVAVADMPLNFTLLVS